VPATQLGSGASTSRARAPHVVGWRRSHLGVRASAGLPDVPPPETLLPHACACAPRLRESPLDVVRRRVRAVRTERATDRRSDDGVPAVRAATEDGYHDGIFVVTPPSPTGRAEPI
jgi:hypothetical protein